MNARTLLHTLRLGVALACLCALHGAQAGQAMLLPEGAVTLIRATTVFNVDAPIALQPGDLLATDAHGGAQIEDGDGTIVALGADTRIAIDAAPRGDALALAFGLDQDRAHACGARPIPCRSTRPRSHAGLRDGVGGAAREPRHDFALHRNGQHDARPARPCRRASAARRRALRRARSRQAARCEHAPGARRSSPRCRCRFAIRSRRSSTRANGETRRAGRRAARRLMRISPTG